jgi:hypothetical protein
MTYGRVRSASNKHDHSGAVVSHLAELVRGTFYLTGMKAPSSAPTGHLLPKGRRDLVAGPQALNRRR